MSGRIPDSFIDTLLTRIDIIDVVQQRVPLKPQGKNFVACCPFHTEKTPSFSVNREKQFYHCFGCGAGGSVIGFMMEYEHLDFVSAVEELAATISLEVPRGSSEKTQSQQPLYQVLQQANQYYQQQLSQHPEALAYLKQRGVSNAIAAQFGLGYATPQWDSASKALLAAGASLKQLELAGLSIKGSRDDQTYDRFRHRIMFPIRDTRGRTIAFGGRTIGDDKAKYLNSPETPVFHKSSTVYGLYETRKNNRQLSQLLVVEGYLDVVALNQHDITQVVATLGTAVNQEHLQQLFKASSNLVFCFDGDLAGRQAAWRALKNALTLMTDTRQISFVFLPDTEDPDSYVRKVGKTGFEQCIRQAHSFSRFFFERLTENLNLDSLDDRSVLAGRAEPLLAHLPAGPLQQLMYQQLHKITGYKSKTLSTLTDSGPPRYQAKAVRQHTRLTPVRRAITLLLEYPALASACQLEKIAKLELAGVSLLRELITLMQIQPNMTAGAIIEHWRDTEHSKHLLKLARLPSGLDIDAVKPELLDIIRFLENKVKQQRFQQLTSASINRPLTDLEKSELKGLLVVQKISDPNRAQE